MAKINLNTSSLSKRCRKSTLESPMRRRDKILEKNNNFRLIFKSKQRSFNQKIKKDKEKSARKRKRRSRGIPKQDSPKVLCQRRSRLEKKGRVRLPSFLDNCSNISDTTLINISDDSCITIPDDDDPPDAEATIIVIPDEQTPQKSADKPESDFKNLFCSDGKKDNQLGSSPDLNYCQPLVDSVTTKEFLPLCINTVNKENDSAVPSSSQTENCDDVVYISDSDEPYTTKNTLKRRTSRWKEAITYDVSVSVNMIDKTQYKQKTITSPKCLRRKVLSGNPKGSTPKKRKVVTRDIGLSPIPLSTNNQTRNSGLRSISASTQKKENTGMIDMSSLQNLSELNKIFTAIPDLPNILKRLGGDSGNNLQNQEANYVDDTDFVNPEKTYTSSGQFISENIYHVQRIQRQGLRPIVIDGSNIAMGHSNGRFFSVKGLKICIDYFRSRGHKVYAFIPSYRLKKNQSTDQALLMDLVKRDLLFCTASRDVLGQRICSYDDRILVQVAAAMAAVIVSGDNYKDLIQEDHRLIPIIKNNLLIPTWVGDMLIFPDDPLGRFGPNLKTFLSY